MTTVLLVDDEPDIRSSLETLLRLRHYDVQTAEHGHAALEMIARDPPDVIVSDFMMPRMNGRDLCARVREDPATADIPIILVGAVDPGPPAYWDAFMPKPLDLHAFFDALPAPQN
jgi:CheY-like chemotaxis protein